MINTKGGVDASPRKRNPLHRANSENLNKKMNKKLTRSGSIITSLTLSPFSVATPQPFSQPKPARAITGQVYNGPVEYFNIQKINKMIRI